VTKLFREVQSAYDVLMDPQERAWYDKHKDAILMKSGVYEDNEVLIGEYFSPSCYSGYGDDEDGFYSVYSKLFKEISDADYTFMNADEEDYPQFGNSDTDPNFVVKEFYGFWQSYFTKRTYVWKEEYDTRDAPNRWVRRKMEQENSKTTEQARKERSKSVQALVDFVRRRDPRVKEYRKLLEEKQRENEEKAKQRKAEQLQAELLRAAEYEEKNRKNLEEEERLLAQLEKELGFSETESYTEDISEDELDELEDLEDFDPDELTEDQKEAIRKQMERDEEIIRKMREASVKASQNSTQNSKKMSKKQKKKQKQKQNQTEDIEDQEVHNIEETPKKLSKKQKKKQKKMASKGFKIDKYDNEDEDEIEAELELKEETFDTEDFEEFDHQLPEEEQFVSKMSKKQKKKLKKQGFIISSSSEEESEDEDLTTAATETQEITEEVEETEAEEIHIVQAEAEILEEVPEDVPVKKLSAKEKRRLREKERQKEAEERKAALKAADVECKICKKEFETRNSLFKHIKEKKDRKIIVKWFDLKIELF